MKYAVVLGSLILGACAPTIWDKPGATQADFNQDSARCRLLARGMNPGDFYAQGSASFVASAALGNAIGTAANQVAIYRDCMMAMGYTPQASGDAAGDNASEPPSSCGGGPSLPNTCASRWRSKLFYRWDGHFVSATEISQPMLGDPSGAGYFPPFRPGHDHIDFAAAVCNNLIYSSRGITPARVANASAAP